MIDVIAAEQAIREESVLNDGNSHSRRGLLRKAALGLGALVSVVFAGGRSQAQYPDQIPKWRAAYQDYPNGRQYCARCTHFYPPDECEVVRGSVSPRGWCRYFRPGG